MSFNRVMLRALRQSMRFHREMTKGIDRGAEETANDSSKELPAEAAVVHVSAEEVAPLRRRRCRASRAKCGSTGFVSVPRPVKTFGEGVIDKGALRRVLARQQFGVKRCYERQLKKKSALKGKLHLVVTIKSNSRAGGIKIVRNTTGDSALKSCIEGLFKRVRYPNTKGGSVNVTVPILLMP